MVGGDESLKDPIFRAMIRAGELAGEVYFATDNDSHKVVGIAVWFPPGKSLFDSSVLSPFIQSHLTYFQRGTASLGVRQFHGDIIPRNQVILG
jgi:hypothetical protein